ncbi:MAG TPA: ComEC/Rec2 family competence protein [Nannocystaceae bacterium]|nr:ComEC/Rec2 family competence protein [Nannocystaceae bacterium]
MLVRNTALWILTVVAIVGGHMLSAAAEPPIIARVVACCSVIALLAALFACFARTARWHRIAFAVVVLALARGLGASDRAAAFAWPAARADLRPGVRTFVVEGASSPGASCHVLAHEGDHGPTFALELPIGLCPLGHGAKVHVPADEIVVRAGASWPGGADPHAVARARGASGSLSAEVAWRGAAGERGYGWWIAKLRQRLWTIGRVDAPRAFVVGSLFGARAALAPVPRHELAIAGLGHLVAVSGMQVSLIAWLLHRAWLRVLSPVVGSIGLAFALAAIPMLAYVGLVGAEAPAVRAAIMVLAAGLAAAVGRPAHGLTVLAWTSVVMLAWRPAWAFDVGFQLSIAAMAAIVRAPSDAGLVLQSWRVGWAIVPVLALCFDETGAWAVPANLVAVPVFALWITPMGIAGAIASPWLGAIAWWPAERGAQLVLDLAHGFAMLPRVPYDAVAIVAVLALVLRVWPRASQRAWVQRWAPSTLVCGVVLGAWVVRASASPTPAADAQWIVLGPKRAPTVIARQPDGAACIRDPGGAPSAWPGLLRALAIDSVGALEPEGAPHTVALEGELDAIGRWHPREGCVWPDDAAIRRAHASCRRHTAGRGDLAAVGETMLSCFADGRWQALH